MDTILVSKEVILTDAEKIERGQDLVKELQAIDNLTLEAKQQAKNFKTLIETHEMTRDDLTQAVLTGVEERDFHCIREKDTKAGVWRYIEVDSDGVVTETIVKEVPFGPEDFQMEIGEEVQE